MAISVGNDTVIRRVGSTVRNSAVFHKSKRAASNTARFSRKLLWSTGKAAWIAGTSFLVLIVPLIIEMDRDQQMVELESQQAGLLGATPSLGPAKELKLFGIVSACIVSARIVLTQPDAVLG